MLKIFITAAFMSLSIINAQAGTFKTYTIPGAFCGNGMPYKVWVKSQGKDSAKLAVEFMGGGACWSAYTCYGPNLRAWVHPLPKIVTNMNVMLKKGSALEDHSVLYFPYCTADVFAGKHVAKYQLKTKVHHVGYTNIFKTIEHLQKNKIIDFNSINDVVLYGSSAGGIGSILHANTFDQYIPKSAKRTIIADSAGMHFGLRFWKKFTKETVRDFKDAFKKIGLWLETSNGLIAHKVPYVCKKLSHWNIGFLQGSKDFVMSTVFGNITAADHRELIYSKKGILAKTQELPNCSAWVPDSRLHAFLLFPENSSAEAAGINALEYGTEVYRGNLSLNYH